VRRLLHPFVLVVSAILPVGYAYIAARLTSTAHNPKIAPLAEQAGRLRPATVGTHARRPVLPMDAGTHPRSLFEE